MVTNHQEHFWTWMSNNGHAGLPSSHRIYQNNVNERGLYACCIFGGNQTFEKGPPLISDNILSQQDRPWFWRQKRGLMLVSSIQPRYGPWLVAGTGEPDPRSNKRSQYCCCCCGALSLSTLLTAYQGSDQCPQLISLRGPAAAASTWHFLNISPQLIYCADLNMLVSERSY